MIWFTTFALLTSLLSSTLASPVLTTKISTQDAPLSKRAWNVDDLNNEFKGIWWNHLFEDEEDCTPEQIDKLVYATRAAMWLTDGPAKDWQYEYSAAWDRYFMKYKDWLFYGVEYLQIASDIMHNIAQVAKFPRDGHHRETKEGRRVHYTCNPRAHGQARRSCAGKQTAATTIQPLEGVWNRWIIVFCPHFFESPDLMYLEERTKGPRRSETSIAFQRTYEHAIVHEFMHVGRFGYREKIIDVETQLEAGGPSLRMYGDDYAHQFSRLGTKGHPNRKVAINADNYAWFFTYYWFDKAWGWNQKKGKHDELRKGDVTPIEEEEEKEEEYEKPEIVFPEPSFPMRADDIVLESSENLACQTFPPNLHSNGRPVNHCQFIGMDYDEWVAELPNPFASKGGCELSPACHRPANLLLAHEDCTCKCDGNLTNLTDERCAGFEGDPPDGLVSPPSTPEPEPAPAPPPPPPPPPAPEPKPKCSWWDIICLITNT